MSLSIEEIEAHPALPNVISLPSPEQKGKVAVANGRGGPFDIAYEIYGTGPVHIVWVMGLGASKNAWHRQSKYFGIDRGNVYSSLVLDNRGVCDSDKPKIKYSTSEMARDLLEVLEHVGWTEERSIHLTGVSMGGMISMEFAQVAPHLLASLTLQSTAASLSNPVPWYQQLYTRFMMLVPQPLPFRLNRVQNSLFSPSFLASPDPLGDFPTNSDRFVAEELWRMKNQTQGPWFAYLLQGLAASTHYFSTERLKKLGELVRVGEGEEEGEEGKPGLKVPVMVYTGKLDKMIEWTHSVQIVEGIEAAGKGKTRLKIWDGSGHALHWEELDEYNKMQEEYFREAEEKLGRGAVFGHGTR